MAFWVLIDQTIPIYERSTGPERNAEEHVRFPFADASR